MGAKKAARDKALPRPGQNYMKKYEKVHCKREP
jgi:hypothetical protein